MAYSPYSSPSPSSYLRDDLLSDLGLYARDLPPSSTPTLSHGTSSSLEDRLVDTDSPGSMEGGVEGRKRQRSDEQYDTHAPRLTSSSSWYLRAQSDPASYQLPSWALLPSSSRPLKRARVLSLSPPTIPRTDSAYAREPAALRKARSLRSDASKDSIDARFPIYEDEVDKSDMSVSPDVDLGTAYIPTRPSTPLPAFLPVPAHPAWLPTRPEAPEDAAARRLQLLLDKEAHMRRELGLASRFDSQRARAREMRYVYSEDGVYAYSDEVEVGEEPAYATDLNPRLLEGAVEWILTVQPPSNSSNLRAPGTRSYSDDLHAQLVHSPETPFFAAVLFRMYWVVESARARAEATSLALEAEGGVNELREGVQGARDGGGKEGEVEGERDLAFDYALAAVALAVKFDRDVLRPLRPVYARDFLRIAPHDICFEELESAQWHILRTFSLQLNIPLPGALLSEIRLASTPLRTLVPPEWMWSIVREDVWWMLGLIVREKDMLKYPLSLLTAAALSEGLQRFTAQRLSNSDFDCEYCVLREPIDSNELMICTGTAIEDVRELVEWNEDAVDECTVWIGGLVREAERSGRRGVLSPEEY